MKITDVTVEALSYPIEKPYWASRGALQAAEGGRVHQARSMVLVRVHTDEGLVGLGESGVAGAPPEVVAVAVARYLKPMVIGEDPLLVERLWHKMSQQIGGSGRRGLLMGALSGIDIALWDIVGKAAGLPVYKVLGAFKEKVPAYASAGFYSHGKTRADLAAEMASYRKAGFRAFKMKIGGLPMADDVARVEAVREVIGDDPLMVDANCIYSPKQAVRMADAIEDLGIGWFEEPVKTDDLEGSAYVAANAEIPIAGYETEYGRYGFRELIAHRAVDIVQPDISWSGGFTECRRIAALAAAHDLGFAAHAFSSAITLVASLHLSASLPNASALEFDRNPMALRDELLVEPLAIDADGFVTPSPKPGLGIELNEDTVARYRVPLAASDSSWPARPRRARKASTVAQ